MEIYAVKFNDAVYLKKYKYMVDEVMITSDISDIYFFDNYDEAKDVAEDVNGYVTTFSEVKP
ncbi:hypothetical protein [Lentilactobacillus kribbianus]|uniref:hypothetical protein n=1 Tax=Lentilactobacillus kribbianus TaxID=2729622 RepID=UPI00155577A3|nr:hypothetical protein [Lentilactobacillus kribbianus]